MAIRKEYNQSWNPFWLNMPDAGTKDYEELENLPEINNTEVKGDKTGADYGLGDANLSDLAPAFSDATNYEAGDIVISPDGKLCYFPVDHSAGALQPGELVETNVAEQIEMNKTAPYTLPKASTNILGGVKVGSGLSIDANGVLSTRGGSTPIQKISVSNTSLKDVGIARAAADNVPELIYIPEMKLTLDTSFKIGKINPGATVSYWDAQKSRSMVVGRMVSGGWDTADANEGDHIVQSLEIPVDGTDAPCVIIRDAIMKRVIDGFYDYFYIKYGKVVVTNTKAGGGYLASGLTGAIFGLNDGQYAGAYSGKEFENMGEIDITSLVKSAAEQGFDDTRFKGAVAKFRVSNGMTGQWAGNIVSNTVGSREIALFKSLEKDHVFNYGIGSTTIYTEFAVDINSSGDGNGFMLTSDYYVIKTPAAV